MRKAFSFVKFARPLAFTALIGGMSLRKCFLQVESNSHFDDKLHQHFHRTIQPEDEFYKSTIILSGSANPQLSKEIAKYLNVQLGNVTVSKFADGECNIQVQDNIRGKDIFIIQPTCAPVNDNLVELLLLVCALRRASARKINVVVPYYGYARQDRKTAPRVPISAADVARLFETVGVDRVISVDLHSGQIQGFFGPRVPVDNLEGNIVALNYFSSQNKFQFDDVAIISPDAGGVGRAKKFQEQFQTRLPHTTTHLAMIIKQRDGPGKIAQMNLVGNVKNRDCIIIDDMIDTAGTLSEAAKVLKEQGAKRVFAFATHGLFNGKALTNIANSILDQVIVTNTVPPKQGEVDLNDRVRRLSVGNSYFINFKAPLLAEAIYRIQKKDSISSLFQKRD
ncbi:hypothetical protein pb186bvf_016231 [Paramecium bursaria]